MTITPAPPIQPAQHPTVFRNARLWVLTAVHTTNDFYGGAVRALLPFFMLYAGYGYVEVAGITLAVTALASVTQPLFGYLSDKYGLHWLSMAGLLASGAGVAISGLVADNYIAVCAAVALTGLGSAAYHPSATTEARFIGGGSSGAMSLFSVGGNLGVALAPAGVVLVMGLGALHWTVLLAVPAILMATAYGLVTRAGRRSRPAPAHTALDKNDPNLSDDWRAFLWLTVVLIGWSTVNIGSSTFVSLFAIERFGATADEGSLALIFLAGAGAVGTLVGGWLADRYGRLRIMRIGYLGAAASTAAVILLPSMLGLQLALVALGFTLFLPFAAHITLAHSYLPRRIGMASGLALGLTFSIGGLATPPLGVLADQLGLASVFVVMVALLVIGFGLSFVLRERAIGALTPGEQAALEEADEEELADLS